MTSRPTNTDLVIALKTALTNGFKLDAYDTPEHRAEVLRLTKGWRGDMWKLANEIERRLCPLGRAPSEADRLAEKARIRGD